MPESEITADILIVDDEEHHAQVMHEALERMGHRCVTCYSLSEARARLSGKQFDVIVSDLVMEGKRDGLEMLALSKQLDPAPPIILVTGHADVPTCRDALAEGAYDYIEKPLDLDYFRAQVSRAAEKSHLRKQNQVLQEQLEDSAGFEGIVGASQAMRKVVQTARQVANSDIPVLIMGESGTGKELVARAIHHNSRRRKNRMVTLNCAGLSESILEDELFGHEKNAFTDARTERAGRFEHADKGTLFMDEIGDMPQSMQAKLLRVLENGEVVRLGSNDPVSVNVRLVSATNRDLEEMVEEKQFRQDLYFRIKGVTILIPPLRERREDIPLLVHFFHRQFLEKYEKSGEEVEPEVQQRLMAFGWPGNVRQLRNVIENMVVLSADGSLHVEDLPTDIVPKSGVTASSGTISPGITISDAEKELIRSTLKMVDGNREQAARMLGIGERTLYRKIKEYELN